jgi:hypothetical protein
MGTRCQQVVVRDGAVFARFDVLFENENRFRVGNGEGYTQDSRTRRVSLPWPGLIIGQA